MKRNTGVEQGRGEDKKSVGNNHIGRAKIMHIHQRPLQKQTVFKFNEVGDG